VRQFAERYTRIVAANKYVDAVLSGELVDRGNADLWTFCSRFSLVRDYHFKFAAEHSTLLIDFADRHTHSVNGVSPDLQLDGCIDTDADRLFLRSSGLPQRHNECQCRTRHY
jgi:hypothetical protein